MNKNKRKWVFREIRQNFPVFRQRKKSPLKYSTVTIENSTKNKVNQELFQRLYEIVSSKQWNELWQ
jgi:hypothetical protein